MKLMAITDNSVQIDFPPLSIPDSQNAIDMLKVHKMLVIRWVVRVYCVCLEMSTEESQTESDS